MSKKDEKKLISLTDRVVKLTARIYKVQQQLTKLESEADSLLRKLLKRNG